MPWGRCYPLSSFFSALAAENLAALLAAMLIVAPVAGLRPVRAARLETPNLPKPATDTSPPAASSAAIASNTASTAPRAWPTPIPALSATLPASSFFVMTLLSDGQILARKLALLSDVQEFRATIDARIWARLRTHPGSGRP